MHRLFLIDALPVMDASPPNMVPVMASPGVDETPEAMQPCSLSSIIGPAVQLPAPGQIMPQLAQPTAHKLLMLLPEQQSESDAAATTAPSIEAEAPLLRGILGLPDEAPVGLTELLAAIPACCQSMLQAWVALGVQHNIAASCAEALQEAATRLRMYAPIVRLLAGGPAALNSALDWLSPLEACSAAISAAALRSSASVLQLLLTHLLPALPPDDTPDRGAGGSQAGLPSQKRLLAATLWVSIYNDRGQNVSVVWPAVVCRSLPNALPTRGRAAIAVATMLGHASALSALLALAPPLQDWGRCLVELALRWGRGAVGCGGVGACVEGGDVGGCWSVCARLHVCVPACV